MEERFQGSLQESILAVLTFDDRNGRLIASQVAPEHFDGVFHEIAVAVLAYYRRYNRAPGTAHVEDLFPKKNAALQRTLLELVALSEGANGEYVLTRVQEHIRSQRLAAALLQANERYVEGGDGAVEAVEGILHGALKFRESTLDAGTFLNNADKALEFLKKQQEFYSLGIPQLDQFGIGPIPKQLLLYIAPKSTGKSWFCVHTGRQCLLQKARVVHVSLEMDEGRVLSRYYQSFFGIAKRPDTLMRSALEFDELDRLSGFRQRKLTPKLNFQDPNIQSILKAKIKHWGARFGRLVIKSFSSNALTMAQLRGYLDYLEQTQKFIPNVLIVDYPRLMKMDTRDLRVSLGNTVVELRGLADERNMALVAPAQSNREGIGARRVGSKNTSEDITQVFTADNVLSYSRTEAEQRLGLGRLTVEHARDEVTGIQILLSQAYGIGQYVMESAFVQNAYWERLKAVTGEGAEEDE